jgi:regulator of sigma E protease
MTVIIFLIVLAVLIFVHELGHFLLAKWNGIRVDEFKIGFGPRILSWGKGETKYGFNIIPFGGYVKIHGENPSEDASGDPDAQRSLVNKNRWRQASVLVAGVFFNFLFAWFLYIVVFASGITATTDDFEKYSSNFKDQRVMITFVEPGSPAEKIGLEVGDTIVGVGGSQVVLDTQGPLSVGIIQELITSSKGPLYVEYKRNEILNVATVTPITGIISDKYAIGISMQSVGDLHLPIFAAIYDGTNYVFIMIRETFIGLSTFIVNIFQGSANFSDVAGPIGIAGIVGNAAEMGFTYLLMITALISINLGVINLLPFPALDGGRILFVVIEGVIRKRISAKVSNTLNTVGFILLMILMVVVTYKDIAKLIK